MTILRGLTVLGLGAILIAGIMGAAPDAANAAAKCKRGDRIYTHGNRIYCISRTKTPKCPRARYRRDYRGFRDMCVRYRANGSVKKVFEPKCGFLGAGPGRLMVRGVDKCAYNPSMFHK